MIEAWGYATLRPFGGVPNSNTSSAKAANNKALADAIDADFVRSLRIGDNDWWFSSAISRTIGRPLRIEGCGRTATRLYFDTGDAGALSLTQSDALNQITISGMSLASSSTTGTGNGLAIAYPATVAGTFPTVRLFDFATLGIDIFNHAFGNSLVLSQCWNAQLGDLHLTGARGFGKERLMKSGLVGTSCTGISISRFKIYSSMEGIVLGGGPAPAADTIDEGFLISDFEIVDVDRGIYHATRIAHAGNGIHNGHINAEKTAIQLYAKHNAEISNLALYKLTNSIENWTGIIAQNCNGLHIHNCLFVDSSLTNSGANFGVVLGGSSDNTLSGLRTVGAFPGFGAVVVVGSGSDDNDISHIKSARSTASSAVIVQAGAGLYNKFTSIAPSAFVPFPANVSTPSIANDVFGAFRTANTAPTTITNFLHGYGVSRFTLLVNDAVTTLQHNANLLLKGATTVTPPNGGVLTFVLDGTSWREVARSF
ncbi:hypothetical protein [Methylorubrum extorquens]|uniref:Pectate lyase superfamily protein domain-containing protein n=1 Tax=Methylorubrum extorquens (strain CM4 / NCIMB 13688) TaxID=440085 RepID=B7KXR8_METC4|nr:hypothetical protein [Methylorubrum extorquens]ACK84670.1 hypothetical protein Mchl_3858 [Methylorubrum extorquens CM4]